MARIDSIGRMRLPPDSGIRTPPHSERERATSEPVKRALTEWFQAVRQGRGGDTDEVLTGALRNILTDRVQRGEPLPRFLPLQVLAQLPPDKNGQLRYQVQLGQSLLELTSRTPLQPGQTLVVAASDRGPVVMTPQTPEQSRLVDLLVQRQQLMLLPAVKRQFSLAPLNSLLQITGLAPAPVQLPLNPGAGSQPMTAPSGSAGGPASTNGAAATAATGMVPAASWMAQLLTSSIQHWRAALPSVPSASVATSNSAATAGTDTARPGPPAGMTAPVANPGATSGPASADRADMSNGLRLQLSQHWIPQLIATAQRVHGEATPATVRQVWQQWHQTASDRLQATPLPDLSRVRLAPAVQPSQPAVPLMPGSVATGQQPPAATTGMPPATGPGRGEGQPPGSVPGAGQAAAPVATQGTDAETGRVASPPTDPAQLVPLLRTLAPAPATTGAEPNPASRRESPALPADVWRLVAEQVLDQRLQQLGQSSHPSLQEQLQRRAEQLRAHQTMTYSPDKLRQQLGQRPAPGAETTVPQQTAVQQEQQSLLQLRQTLEQVSQQQLVRVLQSVLPENPAEQPRILQGIPLLSDQQLLWFELERHAPGEDTAEEQQKRRSWVLDLHFQLPPLAPVCARLHWEKGQAALTFLTDDTPTLRAFHNHLETLQQRFGELGLPVEELQCRYGLPQRRTGNRTVGDAATAGKDSHQIDVRT